MATIRFVEFDGGAAGIDLEVDTSLRVTSATAFNNGTKTLTATVRNTANGRERVFSLAPGSAPVTQNVPRNYDLYAGAEVLPNPNLQLTVGYV